MLSQIVHRLSEPEIPWIVGPSQADAATSTCGFRTQGNAYAGDGLFHSFQDLILDCLKDDDVTIRMRALDLLTAMVSKRNLEVFFCLIG